MSVATRRRLQSLIVVFVSALLLLTSLFNGSFTSSPETKRTLLNDRNVPAESLPTSTLSSSYAKNIALPDGHEELTLNFSTPSVDFALLRRAPPQEPKAWPQLVCTGGEYLAKIQAAFQGNSPPGREFPSSELDNGWSKSTVAFGEELADLGKYWAPVTDKLFPKSRDKVMEVKPVNVRQDKEYKTSDGTHITTLTKAISYAYYLPDINWILAMNSLSPANVIWKTNPGISKEDRDKQLPPLNKLSDLLWVNWNTVAKSPKELRFIGRNHIVNKATRSIMDYLFLRDKITDAKKDDIPWPGLEYSGESAELKALLATPNGLATAWILIDHALELKRHDELTRRELKVNIFAIDRKYFMLWDIEAQSPRGDSGRRGSHAKRHIKRLSWRS
ncbi:MAG: hypothetical protein Q9209_005990 [Squamulea sp. 1 TL-2023]